jgi:DNA repair protein RadC
MSHGETNSPDEESASYARSGIWPVLFLKSSRDGKLVGQGGVVDPLEHASNSELLSKLTGKPAAEALVQHYGGLTDLSKASFDELQHIPGIGQSKAAAIKSAFLLGQRLSREAYPDSPVMDNPESVAGFLREENRAYTVENLQVLFLNTRRRLIAMQTISQGTLDTILVHPREVFASAIAKRASAIVLVHNHPSGDPTPSEADIKVTRDLIRAGQLLKIDVLDHIIIGRATPERVKDFSSLRELGYFYS